MECDLTVVYNTTSSFSLQSFAAAPMPAVPAPPIPSYGGPEDEDYEDPNNFVSNAQMILLGAILGVVATLIYL